MERLADDDRRRPPLAARVLPALALLALAGGSTAGAWAWSHRPAPAQPVAATPPSPVGAAPVAPAPAPPPERDETIAVRIERGQTIGQALARLGLTASDAGAAIAALRPLVPPRSARSGDQILLERPTGGRPFTRLTYRRDRADEWLVERGRDGTLAARARPVVLSTTAVRVVVTIERSLAEALHRAHEEQVLAVLAADVLAWDVDFYLDVRRGDRLALLVEKVDADGSFLRYGEVLAADYQGVAAGHHRLFRWTAPDGRTSYYDDDGQSARRGFLKAPLPYVHVTSGFGNRLHPLLGFRQAHLGIDYGAPPGTPVWAVGDGVVRQAGWNGGCGNSVTLRHRNGIETLYCHLSVVKVAAGRAVAQKQVIGLVGSTGLSTGPHLHFAVLRGGVFVDPAKLKLPRDAPVRREWLDAYRAAIAPLRARLDAEPVALRGAGARPRRAAL